MKKTKQKNNGYIVTQVLMSPSQYREYQDMASNVGISYSALAKILMKLGAEKYAGKDKG